MTPAWHYLSEHWLPLALVALALAAGGVALWRNRRGALPVGWLVAAAAFALPAVGAFLPVTDTVHLWVAGSALTLLCLLLALVILTGHWWNWVAGAAAAALLVGLGGLAVPPAQEGLNAAAAFLASLRPLQPWWLVLLLLLPLIVALSFRSLAGLGPTRRAVAITLRCLAVALLVLALAETHAEKKNENLTVLFLWDRSQSVPQEVENGEDQREARIRNFVNRSVANRGQGHERDKVGMVVFGRWPRLELPPSAVPKLNFRKVASKIDDTRTDIGAAIKLALASFPEGTARRIVLVSDGNQNLGDALEQARIAKQNGVQIDVVPLATRRRQENEVLVERVEVPPVTEKDARVPLRIVVRSHSPDPVAGKLTVIKTAVQVREDEGQLKPAFDTRPILETRVTVRQGLNTFFLRQPAGKTEESYIYEARFVPEALAGDRWENNAAKATVVARGQRAVLLVEPKAGDHQLLVDRLLAVKSSLKVVPVEPERLPQDPTELALVLSKFDSVILANVPSEKFTEEQQKVFRSNTHDQGAGLIMIGGPQGFGAGGWQGTEVEKALPVRCDLKAAEVAGKSGLVLIMHASEMSEGNMWQKQIAKLAVQKLSPNDMIGLLYYDWQTGGHVWHVPFQQIRGNLAGILRQIDSMSPGDMPDAEPSLTKAHDALSNPVHQLGTKHIIFISDGDHWSAPVATLRKIRDKKITCTTVCITTHGPGEVQRMKDVAAVTRGRSYHVTDPKQLPAIYTKETRLISKAFVYEKEFEPLLQQLGGPTEGLPKELESLYGFVRTEKRDSPLVEAPILTPKIGGYVFPVLAYWQYGLGKGVAFTSDARTKEGLPTRFWDHDWASSQIHARFWEQLVEWSLRAVETGKNLALRTVQQDGKIRVIVDARDDNNRPLTAVDLDVGVTVPSLKPGEAGPAPPRFEQTEPGVFEADIPAEEEGAYFLNVRAKWKDAGGEQRTDSVRAGTVVPYSPEFAEMTSNAALLEEMARVTGGEVYPDSAAALAEAARTGAPFRPSPLHNVSLQAIWPWLVLLAAFCLVGDVATRRIAVDFGAAWRKGEEVWRRLRGLQAAAQTQPQFLDRLQTRKSRVGESLEKERAARRFEPGEVPPGSPAPAADVPATPTPPRERKPRTPQPGLTPTQKDEPQDYASRLLRAKKKVWEEKDKDKPQ